MAGAIRFDGRDITMLPVYRRSQLGWRAHSRSPRSRRFHRARQCRAGGPGAWQSFRFWRDARARARPAATGAGGTRTVGLAERADMLVADLSHGECRQLEIAMALVTEPRLLLLDEPMAGMGPNESSRLVETLRRLKGGLTIVLIEHDLDAVFALADRISVLVYGRIVASAATRPRSSPIRQYAKPISANKLISANKNERGGGHRMADADGSPLLELRDVETSYGLSRVLFGMSLSVAPGRNGVRSWGAMAWARLRPCARSWG